MTDTIPRPARRRTANSQQNPGDETPGVFSCPKETNRGEEKLRPENTLLEQESKAASVQIYQSLKNHPKAAQEVAEALGEPFSLQAAHTAVLVMVHALAQTRGKGRPTLVRALKLWEKTLDPQSRFLPIVPLALRLLKALPPRTAKQALPGMIQASEQLNDPAGAGRILQKLTHHRKQLAVYHTKPESAALMARLAIPEGLDWSDPKTVTGYRMADYSCGAGALLIAAYRRVRELHQKSGGSPRKVHAAVLKDSITLVDVLPASVALAAAGLDALEPKPAQPGGATRALTLKYGPISSRTLPSESQEQQEGQERRAIGLGSLDLLDPAALRKQDLRAIGRGDAAEKQLKFSPKSQDLVIMNPPFTKRPDPRNLDQNVPNPELGVQPTSEAELAGMENRLDNIAQRVKAGWTNGLSLHFAHLAHRMVKRGGTIALLLPMSALTSGGGSGEAHGNRRPDLGWPMFRRKLVSGYTNVRIIGIAAFEEQDSTFSHDTYIAEVMILGRRLHVGEKPDGTGCFINLRRRPDDEEDAARLAQAIDETVRRLEEEPPGTTLDLSVDGIPHGNVVKDILPKDDIWTLSRVLDPGLMQAVTKLKRGWLHTGGPGEPIKLPIATLADVARVGPAGHEAEDLLGLPTTPAEHGFPVLRGHDCANQRTLQIPRVDEFGLRPGKENREGRLTGTMSRLHINDNFRYNSQSTQALMTPEPSVGGRGWPNLRVGEERQEKALALWLNTSLGLVAHWAMSNHTQNGLGYLSQKQIKNLPVLDVGRLSHRQLTMMAETFKQVRGLPLLPANEAWRDVIRAELDRRVLEDVLGLGEEATKMARDLCNRWCQEPTVQGRKGGVVKRQPDMAQLDELVEASRSQAEPATHRTPREGRGDEAQTTRAAQPAENIPGNPLEETRETRAANAGRKEKTP